MPQHGASLHYSSYLSLRCLKQQHLDGIIYVNRDDGSVIKRKCSMSKVMIISLYVIYLYVFVII